MTLQEVKTEALRYGYILRRVGHKKPKVAVRDRNGELLRNCYSPHIPCDARTFAHTHRTLGALRRHAEAFQERKIPCYADLWEIVLAILDDAVAKGREAYDALVAERKRKGVRHGAL